MSQQIYQLVTDRVLALLEQGVVPWKKPLSPPPEQLRERPALSRHQPLPLDRPTLRLKRNEDSDEEASATEYRRVLLRYYTVFNLEQCEGIDVPEAQPSEGGPGFDPISACEAVYGPRSRRRSLERTSGMDPANALAQVPAGMQARPSGPCLHLLSD